MSLASYAEAFFGATETTFSGASISEANKLALNRARRKSITLVSWRPLFALPSMEIQQIRRRVSPTSG
jgi:hypothetical protein